LTTAVQILVSTALVVSIWSTGITVAAQMSGWVRTAQTFMMHVRLLHAKMVLRAVQQSLGRTIAVHAYLGLADMTVAQI